MCSALVEYPPRLKRCLRSYDTCKERNVKKESVDLAYRLGADDIKIKSEN